MELLAFVRRVIAWRWTPCVAPVLGSVLIALLTLAVIPNEIGQASSASGPLALRAKRDTGTDTDTENPEPEDGSTALGARTRTAGAHGRPRMAADAVQGFFHKAQDLPIEPVDPTPQAPPPEPPPPAPTATVFTLPETGLAAAPPPVEPGTLPPPDVPLQPLGPTQTERQ